ENFFATTQERGQIHDAELAVAKDGTVLGVKDVFLHDTGAYDPYGLTVPINSQCTLLGPYDIPSYESEFTAVFTNKTIVTPVRGAGRQHGVFVIERLLDFAARELGIDRAEIRRRNLLRPDQFPFNNDILFQDSAPLTYDSGDYEPALDAALKAIDYGRFVREEQPRLRPSPWASRCSTWRAASSKPRRRTSCSTAGACTCAATRAAGSRSEPWRSRRIHCAARCGRAPSRASRPPRTSGPTAAAPRTASMRWWWKWTRKRRRSRSSATLS